MFVITLLTPDEGPSLETSIFSCIVSGSERTFTFRVSLNALPTLATLVRNVCYKHVIYTNYLLANITWQC